MDTSIVYRFPAMFNNESIKDEVILSNYGFRASSIKYGTFFRIPHHQVIQSNPFALKEIW